MKEVEDVWKEWQDSAVAKWREHSQKAKELQAAADFEFALARKEWLEGVDKVGRALDRTEIPVKGGKVRPAVERISAEQFIVGLADDELMVIDEQGKHIFGPADERWNRGCKDCGRQFRWHPVLIAPNAV